MFGICWSFSKLMMIFKKLIMNHDVTSCVKPVTDKQVFCDKFLYGKFYLPSARVYVRQILYDKFLVF